MNAGFVSVLFGLSLDIGSTRSWRWKASYA
jgi:hypothetical protein